MTNYRGNARNDINQAMRDRMYPASRALRELADAAERGGVQRPWIAMVDLASWVSSLNTPMTPAHRRGIESLIVVLEDALR